MILPHVITPISGDNLPQNLMGLYFYKLGLSVQVSSRMGQPEALKTDQIDASGILK